MAGAESGGNDFAGVRRQCRHHVADQCERHHVYADRDRGIFPPGQCVFQQRRQYAIVYAYVLNCAQPVRRQRSSFGVTEFDMTSQTMPAQPW